MADMLRAAEIDTIALKWSAAPLYLSVEPYPFRDLEPKLARALEAYGRERVMWGSDYTVSGHRASWAEALFHIRNSTALSDSDKEWVLGRTLRTLLDWPAPIAAERLNLHMVK